ncbi:MAG: zf-HC2 domain-containing protein [bacterium]
MKCKEICNLLDDYILGELTSELEIQINEHISECRLCKKELREKEAAIIAIKKSTVFEPSSDSFRRIKKVLPVSEKSRNSIWFFPKRFVYALAAFLFGLVLMRSVDILIFRQKEIPQAEIKFETHHQEPFVDTVEFYHAPAKNVAKI